MVQAKPFRVALVGRQLPDNENLGIGYLLTALTREGIAADKYVLNDARDIGQIADAVLLSGSQLVGISIPDGGSAVNLLTFGEMLRKRDYSGKVIAGGPFATLARRWLLERYAWLDAVVRFAGELPLVGIAQALAAGRDFAHVPGVTDRAGDGAAAPVASLEPLSLTPQRSALPNLLGRHAAHIQATRGCLGRCGYCGPAALQTLEQEEGQKSGFTIAELRRRGVGGIRRRSIDGLCDELAALHRQGVRYFYFVDEHFLPYREAEARAYLATLHHGLRRRRVEPLGLGCMLKPERLTEAVLDDLIEVGLVRSFLGLEFATASEAQRFRRKSDPAQGRACMAHLESRGLACIANLMLLHTESTRDSLRLGIEYLETLDAGIVETTRMMVYHGTALHAELEQAQRLTGNPLRYGYRLEDPVAERFANIFVQMRLHALGDHSLAQQVHGIALTLALAQRLYPNAALAGAQAERRQLEHAVRRLTVTSLRHALVLAQSNGSNQPALSEFVAQLAESVATLLRRVDALEREISALLRVPGDRFSPTRAAATHSLTFALLGGTLAAACGGLGTGEYLHPTPGIGGNLGSGGNPSTGGSPGTGGDRSATAGGSTFTSQSSIISIDSNCAAGKSGVPFESMKLRIEQQVPCYSGTVSTYGVDKRWYVGRSTSTNSCMSPSECESAQFVYTSRIETALQDLPPPSCTGSVRFHGGAEDDLTEVESALRQAGCYPNYGSFSIEVDASGKFVDVIGPSLSTTTLDCMRQALSGLFFPCLDSMTICPELCILE